MSALFGVVSLLIAAIGVYIQYKASRRNKIDITHVPDDVARAIKELIEQPELTTDTNDG